MLPNNFRDLTVILTGAGAPGWPDIFRCLIENGERQIDIIAVDMDNDVAGYHLAAQFAVVSPGRSPDYIPQMLDLVLRCRADAIVPLTDFELLPLARALPQFKQMNVVIPVASASALEIATDKIRLHDFLAEEGLGVPEFAAARNLDEFEQAVKRLGYPQRKICFKPGVAHGSRGFRILDPNAVEAAALFSAKVEESLYSLTFERALRLLAELKNFPPLLLTEFLPGMEYSVDLLIRDGEILSAVCRERSRVRFGLTYQGKVVDDPALADLAARIALKVGLNYNANLQFKRAEDGQPKILEINPRTSGTIALCRAAGVNLPYLGLKLTLGETVAVTPPVIGTRNYRYWTHVFKGPEGRVIEL
jgi:carbamoyl-phosphate synthase large subunit